MNSIAFNIIPGIIVLGFLIFVHELGHFLMAKLTDAKSSPFHSVWKETLEAHLG